MVLVYTVMQTAGSRYLSLSRGVLIPFHRDSSLLRGSRGGYAASHRFSFAVKVRCKRYALSPIQPLSHRWFLIKDIKALVCPFAVLRSRFGFRYSCVRGRRQSKFLAASATGGARNFYPCTGEPRSALSSPQRSLAQGSREEYAQFALQRTGSRELHLIAAVAPPLQDVPRPAAHLNISPKGRNISHARSAYFTAPQARFHTAAKLPYITAARRDAYSLLQPFGTKKSL